MLAYSLPFFIDYSSDITIDSCDVVFDSPVNDCCDTSSLSESGIKKNEVGRKIAVNIAEDISNASNYEIILTHNKYTLTVGPSEGVLRPNEDVTFTPCGATEPVTFLANQYLYYVVKDGDIPYSGDWNGRSHIQFTSPNIQNLFGNVESFEVGE